MNLDRLGSVFDIRDQGQAMQYTAWGWLAALPLFGIANISATDSVAAAICRLGGLLVYIFTLLAFFASMPRYLRHAKYFCSVLTVMAFLLQFNGVFHVMAISPQINEFFTSILMAQFLYILVAATVGYCFFRHPLFPHWLAFGMVIDSWFWTAFYWLKATGNPSAIIQDFGGIPMTALEIAIGICLYRNGRIMINYASRCPAGESDEFHSSSQHI